MTETEWLECADCRDLISGADSLFAGWKDTRTPRLLACAACRLDWNHLTDPRSRAAVEVAERLADGKATHKELTLANRAAMIAYREARPGTTERHLYGAVGKASRPKNPTGAMLEVIGIISGGNENPWESVLLAMLHDVFFRRFFRPIELKPVWLTSDVNALAAGIYDERAFDRLPILADALQDAGCDNEDVLNHCRDTSLTHVRGCWVVDRVLGKE